VKLQKDLKEFIELLNSHGVEYLVVGGHAVAYHGHPRYTGDIDFFVRPSLENAARVESALRAFGFVDSSLDASTFTEPNRVVTLGLIRTQFYGDAVAIPWYGLGHAEDGALVASQGIVAVIGVAVYLTVGALGYYFVGMAG
jgi:hypothetical protein